MHNHPTWRCRLAGFSCCPPLMDLNTTQEFLQLRQPSRVLLPGIGKGRDRDSRRETALGSPEQEGPIQAQKHLCKLGTPPH